MSNVPVPDRGDQEWLVNNTGCHHIQEALNDMRAAGYDIKDLDDATLANAADVVISGTAEGYEASVDTGDNGGR